MTLRSIRNWTLKLGRIAVLTGGVLLIGGAYLNSPLAIGLAVLIVCIGAYAMTFGFLGSY